MNKLDLIINKNVKIFNKNDAILHLYSRRWIEQPFAARGKERRKERGKERRKERGKEGLKINLNNYYINSKEWFLSESDINP